MDQPMLISGDILNPLVQMQLMGTYGRKNLQSLTLNLNLVGNRYLILSKPFRRNNATDWRSIYSLAKEGRLEEIADTAPDVIIRHYGSIKKILQDNLRPPVRRGVVVKVYWGNTGTGKTHRSFEEAGTDAYPKGPTSIWWDGYRKETNVVIDEFSGAIRIEHLLRWLDWQPCIVEVKGSSSPLHARNFWITSNIDPKEWYNDGNSTEEQRKALQRRLTTVVHFIEPFRQ